MNGNQNLRQRKKIQNMRAGRTRKICGIIFLAIGLYNLMYCMGAFSVSFRDGLQSLVVPVLFIVAGVWMYYGTKKEVERWDKYEKLINPSGNTSLKMLSRKTGISLDKVRKDIQKMVNNGFFMDENGNIGAYINKKYDVLVMMRNGEPLEPVEETARREDEEAGTAEKPAAAKEGSEEAYADIIALAAERISDDDVVESLGSIEASIRKIDKQIKRNPELKDHASVQQLREIYLPKTAELVSKLIHEEVGSDTMLEIKGILHTCSVAYESIVEKLYKREDEDTLIDIEVLKQTFEREGLLGSDFDFE